MTAFIVTVAAGVLAKLIANSIISHFEAPSDPPPSESARSSSISSISASPQQSVSGRDFVNSPINQDQRTIIIISQSSGQDASSRVSDRDDDGTAYFVLALLAMIALGLIGMLFVQVYEWIALSFDLALAALSLLSIIVLILGIRRGFRSDDWGLFKVSLFATVLLIGAWGASWNVLAPPAAPEDFIDTQSRLRSIRIGEADWLSDFFDVIFSHPYSTIIIGIQSFGIIPMIAVTLLIAYLVYASLSIVLTGNAKRLRESFVSYAPLLILGSAIFLGLIPMLFSWFSRLS